jgi:ubiquinone/menaquinone biosynthesis C-methylase UbiE
MASKLALRLQKRFYGHKRHPYTLFESEVERLLKEIEGSATLLDIGCGREAPVLRKFKHKATSLIGLEMVEFRDPDPELRLISGSISKIPLPDQSVDVAMARSVMEHVVDPYSGIQEVSRILKPGGYFVFLTPSLYDYASIIAMLVPNRFHGAIVRATEGRKPEDVFPTVYKCNTKSAVLSIAKAHFMEVRNFQYLSQYPNYFMFSGTLFAIATAYEKLISSFSQLDPLKGWILVTLQKPDEARQLM